jgi:hypothetical protein
MQLQNIQISGGLTFISEILTPSGDPYWANVSLLMNTTSTNNQTNNTFLDSSSSNLTVTRAGTTTQGSFTPFTVPALTSYSAATYGGSGSFNGSSNYLTTPSSAGYQFGTGDFTVEAWVYVTTAQNGPIIDTRGSSSAAPWAFYIDANRLPYFYDGANVQTSNVAVTLNTWTHVVAVRASGTLSIYVGGQRGYNASLGTTMNPNATVYIGGQNFVTSAYFAGFIANLRVVKGTAVYSGTSFTPPTAPVTAISGTSLLLNFTNAGMYDAATKNNLLGVGDAKVTTTESKFAPTSAAFDGTGDYLSLPTNSGLAFGTGDFTVESWVYFNNLTGSKFLIDMRPENSDGVYPVLYANGSTLTWYISSAARITGSLSSAAWLHIAVSRTSGITKMFINGTQVGSNYTDSNNYLSSTPAIGSEKYPSGSNTMNGYVDEFRITKGVGRYTANFTPPTAAFPTF